ncbi:MAG TPA: chemotaxis protein CheW [Denitromonas sp.]|uniref:chemotaxis protein CheW n=1 Tax=Denitromonas sp. TaxID=2734609 RepID=UPI001D1FF97F|nr:chemotaxis protein CheW [Rhodocyclaceae bacterium]MCP5220957.1 chemotaxis protein CheW [Zoogloeaceae bacterium]HPR06407.1 chemotaxis protein CheW [Denitromonas sp.]HQU87556.1 chemotaxis protein CheW [Denitromonas sp.]HQV14888.1 chemotaxis protein CheW [Denitromonas sp.]
MQYAATVHRDYHEEDGLVQEFLSFILGDEEYAIDILTVQEIRGYDPVTAIANAPAFIKGVINLRGTIVPIVDLRIKFGVGKVEYTAFTVVIILNIGARVMGIVVDSVSDVVSLAADAIHPTSDFSSQIGAGFLKGLGTVGERMLILLDIERMMHSRDMALVDSDDAE